MTEQNTTKTKDTELESGILNELLSAQGDGNVDWVNCSQLEKRLSEKLDSGVDVAKFVKERPELFNVKSEGEDNFFVSAKSSNTSSPRSRQSPARQNRSKNTQRQKATNGSSDGRPNPHKGGDKRYENNNDNTRSQRNNRNKKRKQQKPDYQTHLKDFIDCPLFDANARDNSGPAFRGLKGYGTLGFLRKWQDDTSISEQRALPAIYLNTQNPFLVLSVGSSGSGKTHTTNTVVENCMLQHQFIQCKSSMTALSFFYSKDTRRIAEVVSVASRAPSIKGNATVKNIIVLVPYSMYKQRKAAYKSIPNTRVHPLLFDLKDLPIDFLCRLFTSGNVDQFTRKILTHFLSDLFSSGRVTLESLKKGVDSLVVDMLKQGANPGFKAVLDDRMKSLMDLLYTKDKEVRGALFDSYFEAGSLVVVDLTSPFQTRSSVNTVYGIVLDYFANVKSDARKLFVLDDFDQVVIRGGDLEGRITDIIMNKNKYNISMALSSSDPTRFNTNHYAHSSVVVLHHLFSSQYWNHISKSIHVPTRDTFDIIRKLPRGNALVFSSKARVNTKEPGKITHELFHVTIRLRLTGAAQR